MRTIPSPYSIATTHTVEEMEQQEGKWFMNNLRAMIQDELKQALNGLIPLPASEMTPIATISLAFFHLLLHMYLLLYLMLLLIHLSWMLHPLTITMLGVTFECC